MQLQCKNLFAAGRLWRGADPPSLSLLEQRAAAEHQQLLPLT